MSFPSSRYKIEKGQDQFRFDSALPNPEDYAILALPNWNTTIFLINKTSKGFTLGFGTPCPQSNGWLDLTIYSPPRSLVTSQQDKGTRTRYKETKRKIPKEVNYV